MSKPVIKEPTDEQIKEFWEWCGFWYNEKEMGSTWVGGKWHHRTHYYDWRELPPIDLNNLFKYAVPKALDKLETRFDTLTNTVRGLEMLFAKWIQNMSRGYSVEDALFWAIYEVIHGR